MASEDKHWAKEYILDPLTAPQPAEETGPGTRFRPDPEPAKNGIITPPQSGTPVNHAGTKELSSVPVRTSHEYPTPRKSPPAHRQEAFGHQKNRSRGSSLGERFPGDPSVRPLDQLKQEKAIADRSRHITKKHHVQPDQVDLLDESTAGGAYHHGGPYDATLFARNNSWKSAPVSALEESNAETIKATPKERIVDSLQGHRPLDGVASYAPGEIDRNGHEYRYEAGENMMIDNNPEGGAYKRWPGVQYHPDDIKGKGEPSYSIDKAVKKHDDSVEKGLEMTDRPRGGSLGQAFREEGHNDDSEVRRSGSFSKRLSGGFKRRIGSLKKATRHED